MRTNMETSIEKTGIPGISVVSVTSVTNPVTEQAGIIANKDGADKTAVKKDTIFEAASLSKPVFAYIVLKMVERGELNLDTPLYEYYPKLKDGEGYNEKNGFGPPELREHPNYKKLTARLILSHQACLPNEFQPKKDNPALPDFEYVSSDVGKKFDYSGEAYRFLLDVVKRETGKELEQLAQEAFLEMKEFSGSPMTHSSFRPPKDISNLAVGHLKDGEMDPQRHFYFPHPAASLYTTAEDYGLFMKACVNDPFIRKHLFEVVVPELTNRDDKAMTVSSDTLNHIAWGNGIGLQKSNTGSLTAFHWGDANQTCRNFMAINLETNQATACFTNSANGPAIFRQIAEPIVGNLDAACEWLYTREGYNQEKFQNFKESLEDIRDAESRGNINVSAVPK